MTDPATYITGKTVQEQMEQLIGYVDTRSTEVAEAAVADDVAACAQAKTDAESARDAAVAAKDTAVSTVSDCVKKTPAAAQTISNYALTVSQGVIVPTEIVGTYSTKAANSTKVKNELDNYAPMVRTTGAQTVAGVKTFTGDIVGQYGNNTEAGLVLKSSYQDVTAGTYQLGSPKIVWYDKNGVQIAKLQVIVFGDGRGQLSADIRNSDGTTKAVSLATGDVI